MAEITIRKARTIIKAALAKGKELGLKPLAVTVLEKMPRSSRASVTRVTESWCSLSHSTYSIAHR